MDVAAGNGSYLVELTAQSGLQTQVALVTGMGGPYGGHAAYVDSFGNVYATDTADAQIVYVPFFHGAYPSGVAYSTLKSCSAFPVPASQAIACTVPLNYTSDYGYYIQSADVALDGSGNLYIIDKYTGGSVATQVNKIIEFPAATNTPILIMDNLPNQSSAELAVDAAGDIWYEDGTGNNYYIAAGSNTKVSLGAYYITGVSIDSKGTVYLTQSNGASGSQIIGIPQVGTTACAGTGCLNNQYTVASHLSTNYTTNANGGIGIDGTGRLYYGGSYPNSLNSLYVNTMSFGATAQGTTTAAQTWYVNFGNNSQYKLFGSFNTPAPFAVSGTTCSNGTNYGPYATSFCTVNVTYTATAAGVQTATLQPVDTGGNLIVAGALSGIGTGSATISGPSSIVYGSTPMATYTATAPTDGTYTVSIAGTTATTTSVTTSGGTGIFYVPILGAGSYTLSLTAGSTVNKPVMVAAAPLLLSAASATRTFDASNPTFTGAYSGFVYGDTSTVVTGTPTFTTTATRVSPAGTYAIVPSAGSATAANYVVSTFGNGTLTVTGGVPQTILFTTLPNFTHGTTVTLAGVSTSGLPLTYTVTSGPASVTGAVLTISGTGAVTITASQPGNSSYAAATSVARSFTAQ
jgi:hypothetical protein